MFLEKHKLLIRINFIIYNFNILRAVKALMLTDLSLGSNPHQIFDNRKINFDSVRGGKS